MFHEHAHKLVIWKFGLYFLAEIMIRFTVWPTKASLTQNVAVLTMSSSPFFDTMFIRSPTVFKALKFSGPKVL